MDNEVFKKIGSKIKNLPTLPTVAAKILEITENPESTINEIKEIISMDQVVASRLLRAVNSAYYGFPRTIDSLSQAIVILGFNNVRSLALSVSFMDIFSVKGRGGSFNHAHLWQHSVGVAYIARALAKSKFPNVSEQCFVSGLLHDIGFIPIAQVIPGQFKMLLDLSSEKQIQIYDAEKEVLGFTHADVGDYMAEQWLLPDRLKEAISLHHEPREGMENPIVVNAVHAADIIAKTRSFDCFKDEPKIDLSAIHPDARAMFNIKENLPKSAEEFLEEDLEQAQGFISMFNA